MSRYDPESSWSNMSSTSALSSSDINPSVLTFEVQFIGFVPILGDLSKADRTRRSMITRSCTKTVVNYTPMDQFATLINNNKVGPFVRLKPLDTNMLVTKNTITLFHIDGIHTRKIGRYTIFSLSCYNFEKIGDHTYFGFIASNGNKCECNVLKLSGTKQKDHIENFLKRIEQIKPSQSLSIESRMGSSQDFRLTKEMSLFYHGKIENIGELIPNLGNFLFRDSRSTPEETKNIFLTYRNLKDPNLIECSVPAFTTEDMYKLLRNYQKFTFEQFRNPIPRLE